MKIAIIGDTHGKWFTFSEWINKFKPEIIISTGDFGIWPRWSQVSLNKIQLQGAKLYFCAGNHEDWNYLDSQSKNEVIELHTNIFYVPSGNILDIDNHRYLFIGGGDSIDKDMRTPGFDWFPQEVINNSEFERIINKISDQKFDTVISHTCPTKIFNQLSSLMLGSKYSDPTRIALQYILEKYKPKQWIFSHFHLYKQGKVNDCKWICLNQLGAEKFAHFV